MSFLLGPPPDQRTEIGPGSFLELYPTFLSTELSDRYLSALLELPFKQLTLQVRGRAVPEPHRTLWVGDPGAELSYSGARLAPHPWTPELTQLRALVEAHLELRYRGVLVNLYETGQDYIGWHSDKRTAYGATPTIASLSLGAVRTFLIRSSKEHCLRYRLPHGSLLVMRGRCQQDFKHSVPKELCDAPRVNLTFRLVQP